MLLNVDDMKNTNTTNATAKGYAVLVVIIFVVFIMIKSCLSGPDKKQYSYSKTSALIDSRQFVEKRLKCPSTAKFSAELDGVSQSNDTTFFVKGYVDSQNGFGAMIRSVYNCIITYMPSINKVQCDNLVIK
jgi:hypothetical protein